MDTQVRFQKIWQFMGFDAPNRVEADVRDMEVIEGAIPAELNGTFYCAGPEPQYPPHLLDPAVFLNGEGMTHMFRFENGHVDYKSRWVRNERFLAQEAARRSLFGRYRNRYTNDPLAEGVNPTTANTHAIWHGGKLLVLKEDGMPMEMDPDTLETKGAWDFDGKITSEWLCAHPKIDMATDEMFMFAYQAKGDATTDFAYYVMGPDGKVTHEAWFDMPFACNVHDFGLTKDWVIFPFYPLITDLETLKQGGPFYEWHRDKLTWFAVMPRYGNKDQIRWFKGDPCFAAHVMNASQDGDKLYFDCDMQDVGWQWFPNRDGSEQPREEGRSVLTRVTFDLSKLDDSYEVKHYTSMEVGGAMGRTDDRLQGHVYRHGWFLTYSPNPESMPPIEKFVSHVDWVTGKISVWNSGEYTLAHEPRFIPRHAGAEEGDGWILTTLNRLDEGRSDLVLLDARNIEAGPVARIRVPLKVRSTFHGMWVSNAARESQRYAPEMPAVR